MNKTTAIYEGDLGEGGGGNGAGEEGLTVRRL